MKQADREILETLNRQDQPRYASWLISRNKRRYGLFSAQDLAEDFLAPLVRAGLIAEIVVKTRSLYQIISAGRIALLAPEDEKPLEIVPPRERPFVSWDGIMKWDTASERGCHRGIGSVGVAC